MGKAGSSVLAAPLKHPRQSAAQILVVPKLPGRYSSHPSNAIAPAVPGVSSSTRQQPDRPGVGHVCLEVNGIFGVYERLLEAGAMPLGEMTEIRDPNMKACSAGYVRDPNAIIIELLEIDVDST